MGGGGTDTVQSTTDIPERYRPFVDNTLNAVHALSNLGPDAFQFRYQQNGDVWRPEYDADGNITNGNQQFLTGGDAMVAGFSGDQQRAFNDVRARQGHLTPLFESAAGAAYDIGAGQSVGQQAAYDAIDTSARMPGVVTPLFESAAGAAYDIGAGQTFDNLQAGQEVTRGIATGQQRIDDAAYLHGVNQQSIKDGRQALPFQAQYQNAFEDQVIGNAINDMGRAAALSAENARLSSAGRGAFGSQNDLAVSELNRNFMDRAGNMAANARYQGFNTALGAAQQDANRMQQADITGSQQRIAGLDNATRFQADNLNRQLAASQQLGQMDLGLANARLQASNALANQAAARGQFGLASAGQAGQLGLSADQARLGASNALAGQAAARQNYELTDANALAAQGANQQALNQAMIDADYADFAQQVNLPFQQAGFRLGALGQAPMGGVSTQPVQRPDRFGQLLGAGAQMGAAYLCWVAREVYGADNIKWVAFRGWLTTEAPKWLLNLYTKHGERFAGWLKHKPIIKGIIRRLMDKAIGG